MCANFLGRNIRARPWVFQIFGQMDVTASDRFTVHDHIALDGTDHFITLPEFLLGFAGITVAFLITAIGVRVIDSLLPHDILDQRTLETD